MNTQPDSNDPWLFCNRVLVDVSRSFALIIPRCPPPVDRCMCVGYLLCRIADTIEDEEYLSTSQRELLYDAFLSAVDRPDDPTLTTAFIQAWPRIPSDEYGELISGAGVVLDALQTLPGAYRPAILTCVHDMVAGMRSVRPAEIINTVAFICRDLADLDRYCHFVAGTVGIMSTALFEQHIREHSRGAGSIVTAESPATVFGSEEWREDGRRMGLGLQMTNIIKDACVDAGRGVSFIPTRYVEFADAIPRLTAGGRAELIRHTLTHLEHAIAYTLAIPPHEKGIRTFLLGSILPAVATLEIASAGLSEFPKIDRATMSALLEFIETDAGNDAEIREFFNAARERCVLSAHG